jgi:hypothetical protein
MDISLAISRLQEIDILDHAGRYGRLAREAIEALNPTPLAWDAPYNYGYEPVERRAAEIYAAFEYKGSGEKPKWQVGGNSLKQDQARQEAREELRQAGHTP